MKTQVKNIQREREVLRDVFGKNKSYSIITEEDLRLQSKAQLPTSYKVLSREDHTKRIETLVQMISRDTASDADIEEYGWRLINQPKI